jgi:hypothetical protein
MGKWSNRMQFNTWGRIWKKKSMKLNAFIARSPPYMVKKPTWITCRKTKVAIEDIMPNVQTANVLSSERSLRSLINLPPSSSVPF